MLGFGVLVFAVICAVVGPIVHLATKRVSLTAPVTLVIGAVLFILILAVA